MEDQHRKKTKHHKQSRTNGVICGREAKRDGGKVNVNNARF